MGYEETAGVLIDLIRKIVREEIRLAQTRSGEELERYRHCKVIQGYDENGKVIQQDGTKETDGRLMESADITDMTTGEVFQKVTNQSGSVLVPGDIVRVYETNGNFYNRYIGLKCWSSNEYK